MSDQVAQLDTGEVSGWYVIDPDGCVVASGPISEGLPADVAEADSAVDGEAE